MQAVKSFTVLGEPVDIVVTGEMSSGLSCVLIQTSPPGGGPPPHHHEREDEIFHVLEGEFEFLKDGTWVKAGKGDTAYGPRGKVHTFRNAGKTDGKILIVATPAGLETYLEKISVYKLPEDLEALIATSEGFGIRFAVQG